MSSSQVLLLLIIISENCHLEQIKNEFIYLR